MRFLRKRAALCGPPFYVRSGGFYLEDGSVGGPHSGVMGNHGQFWPSRASSTRYDGAAIPGAYSFAFTASAVRPSHGPIERWYAFPLRCLSTVLGM